MAANPRVVLVTRPTDYQLLLNRHGTRGQAEFFLANRGRNIDQAAADHDRHNAALCQVRRAIPASWRVTSVERADLDRFVFEPADIVVVLGQDGLVANLAKYLDGQLVIGLNPDPARYEGVLVSHLPADTAELLAVAVQQRCRVEQRTMVAAKLDDGQVLHSLNEVFVGHASHQSARYIIEFAGQKERQSSSGLIIATGTGASGWARSIHRGCRSELSFPAPDAPILAYFVREPWPSVATGTGVVEGLVTTEQPLSVISEMDERGVIFGDGIEQDYLQFGYGQKVTLAPADRALRVLAG